MDSLPKEVLDLILARLDGPLASYATVCRAWQHSIESRTFANIAIKHDPDETNALSRFHQVFARVHRQRYVRNIAYEIVLPRVSESRLKKMQSRAESAKNDRVFTKALQQLFERLSTWSTHRDAASILKLEVEASSPSDDDIPEHLVEEYEHNGSPIWEVRNDYKYLEINTDTPLPVFDAPVDLELGISRQIHPLALKTIISALPRMSRLHFTHVPPPRRALPQKIEMRDALYASFSQSETSALETLTVFMRDSAPINETLQPQNLVSSPNTPDMTERLFHRLSSLPRLKRLTLDESWLISPSIFALPNTTPPPTFFPALESLTIHATHLTPTGQWFLTGDPQNATQDADADAEEPESDADFDSDDSDTSDYAPLYKWAEQNGDHPCTQFRSRPDPAIFNPFAAQLAEFVNYVESLKTIEVTLGVNTAAVGTVSLEYFAPGIVPGTERYTWDEERQFLVDENRRARWIVRLACRGEGEQGEFECGWEIPGDVLHAMKGRQGDGVVLKGTKFRFVRV